MAGREGSLPASLLSLTGGMSTVRKRISAIISIVVAVLVLAACGLWTYMNAEVPLGSVLPQDQWLDVSLIAIVFEDGQTQHRSYLEEQKVSQQIRQTLYTAQVERARPFDDMRADILWIVISTEEDHEMWNLALGENGLLRITSEDKRNYYFENCQELYRQMQNIVAGLPLTE